MDAATHLLWGAGVALLSAKPEQTINTRQRILVAAVAALFPDIDYLVLLWNPLDFLAYWHRAETHSLLLAPLWAWLLSLLWRRYPPWQHQGRLLFLLSLGGLLSHILLDSLTVFGTRWFAPLSDYSVAWDLLFVVDGYFSFCSLVMVAILFCWPRYPLRWLSPVIPSLYLLLVVLIKQDTYAKVDEQLQNRVEAAQPRLSLLPQPFSPVYWQVIIESEQGTRQAWLKRADDRVGALAASLLRFDLFSGDYRLPAELYWRQYSLSPRQFTDSQVLADISTVWGHPEFRAFPDYARYPVLYDYQQSGPYTCVWFSDLRYHWPYMKPSFRFGMCHKGDRQWTLHWMNGFPPD